MVAEHFLFEETLYLHATLHMLTPNNDNIVPISSSPTELLLFPESSVPDYWCPCNINPQQHIQLIFFIICYGDVYIDTNGSKCNINISFYPDSPANAAIHQEKSINPC